MTEHETESPAPEAAAPEAEAEEAAVEAASEPAATPAKGVWGVGTGKRLSEETWEKIRDIYEHGEASILELSARFDVSKTAISEHFKKRKVIKGSKRRAALEAGAKKSIGAEEWARARADRIAQVRMSQFQANVLVQAEVTKILAESRATSTPIHVRSSDLKALDKAADVLGKTRIALLEVLDAANYVDDAELPTFEVADLTKQMIADASKGDDEDDLGSETIETEDDEAVVEGEDEP